MICIAEISNRLLPSANFEFTDNSVVMTVHVKGGEILTQNSYPNLEDCFKHYKKICKEVKKQLEKTVSKTKSKKVKKEEIEEEGDEDDL